MILVMHYLIEETLPKPKQYPFFPREEFVLLYNHACSLNWRNPQA